MLRKLRKLVDKMQDISNMLYHNLSLFERKESQIVRSTEYR